MAVILNILQFDNSDIFRIGLREQSYVKVNFLFNNFAELNL